MADTIGGGINPDGSVQNTSLSSTRQMRVLLTSLSCLTLRPQRFPSTNRSRVCRSESVARRTSRLPVLETSSKPSFPTKHQKVKPQRSPWLSPEDCQSGIRHLRQGGNRVFSSFRGQVLKPSVTTAKGKASDSISFASAAKVTPRPFPLGKGPDTITFTGGHPQGQNNR